MTKDLLIYFIPLIYVCLDSDENLHSDHYLISQMDDQGWVPISVIADFKRVIYCKSCSGCFHNVNSDYLIVVFGSIHLLTRIDVAILLNELSTKKGKGY